MPPCLGNYRINYADDYLDYPILSFVLNECLNLVFIRERICVSNDDDSEKNDNNVKKNTAVSLGRATLQSPPREKPESAYGYAPLTQNGFSKPNLSPNSLLKSASKH